MSGLVDFSQLIPLFPLPNVVLMPGAILPLHIFEPRYREMTKDALTGNRLIAMALLKPGFEEKYHTPHVQIYKDVCVGRILKEEELCGGRFNLLLRGLMRASVVKECTREKRYRRAILQPVHPEEIPMETEVRFRREFHALLTKTPLVNFAAGAPWFKLLESPNRPLSEVVDIVGFEVLQTIEDKQRFLAEPLTAKRAQFLYEMLQRLAHQLARPSKSIPRLFCWPPKVLEN